MIPNNIGTEAVVSAQMETSSAEIAMTAEMMDLLSSGIYTDKITAVIRETSCNATDGNRAKGHSEPIRVHLPTTFQPYYSVRDTGIGLSHDDIMNLYMTYGASRKRDTNELIGGFGIGSKSPFAYTDAFTVTSWFHGVRTMYSIYKSKGIPQCTVMNSVATTEPNGIEVKVPVRGDDVRAFRDKAEEVYKGFDTKPIVNVEINMTLGVVDTFPDYFTTRSYGVGKVFAKVGDVIYGVDHESVDKFHSVVGSNHNHYLLFNIGDVDIAGSREKLSMTETTEKSIKDFMDNLIEEVVEAKIAELSSAISIFEFRDAIKACDIALATTRATFKGKTYNEWNHHYDSLSMDSEVDYLLRGWSNKVEWHNTFGSTIGQVFNPLDTKYERIVILKDSKVGGITEAKAYAYNKRHSTIPFFECEDKMNTFIKLLDWEGCKIVKTSELREKTTYKKREVVQIEVIQKVKNSGWVNIRKIPDFDVLTVNKPVYFIETFRDGYIDEGGRQWHIDNRFENAILNGFVGSVFKIRSATVRKITNPRSKMYNPNFKRWNNDEVFGELSTKERKALSISHIKSNVNLSSDCRELLKDSGIIDDREARLLLISKNPNNTDKALLKRANTKVSYTDKGHKVNVQLLRSIKGGRTITAEGTILARALKVYPFLKMVKSNFSNELDIPRGMLPYLKHLVSETNKGTFK